MNEVLLFLVESDGGLQPLSNALMRAGYRIFRGPVGDRGLRLVYRLRPDLVLVRIGSGDGLEWETCHLVRRLTDLPLVLIVASGRERDREDALELGADDYLMPPVSPLELVARVRTLLEYGNPPTDVREPGRQFVDGDISIDLVRREVRRGDRHIPLSPTEVRLLACLVERAGRVVPREELIWNVWGAQGDGKFQSLQAYIHSLRKKIEDDHHNPTRIITHHRVGYSYRGEGKENTQDKHEGMVSAVHQAPQRETSQAEFGSPGH